MILITGASQGIGYACARGLLARTDSVVLITGRSEQRLTRARADVPPPDRERLRTCASDQDRREDVEALTRFIADASEPVEGAILCVGVNPAYADGPRRLHSLTEATIEATLRVNCTHTLLLTQALLERFWRQRSGVLLWIGSQGSRMGLRGAGLYCATKSFLSGLAHTAHQEYAERGVRVHLLHPALVRTPRTELIIDDFAARHGLVCRDAPEVADQVISCFLSGADHPVEVNL